MIFYPFTIVSITHNLRLCGANAPIFCVNFLYVSFVFFKCRSKSRENLYEICQTKNEKLTESCTYLRKILLHLLKFLP